jgi:hypothetical protein
MERTFSFKISLGNSKRGKPCKVRHQTWLDYSPTIGMATAPESSPAGGVEPLMQFSTILNR